MSSAQTTTKGAVTYAAPLDNTGAKSQTNIFKNAVAVNSGLRALQGTTIRGQIVGTLEKWSDGSVYDTTNNRYLYAGSDFDPAILNRA